MKMPPILFGIHLEYGGGNDLTITATEFGEVIKGTYHARIANDVAIKMLERWAKILRDAEHALPEYVN